MPIVIVDGPTIAAGASLSNTVDLTAGRPVRITMPAEWTPAPLTFQVSSNGEMFNDLYLGDFNGVIRRVQFWPRPGMGIALPQPFSTGVFYRFRSGTARAPVPQPLQCLFAVAIETAA